MIELNYILDPAYRRETEAFDLHEADYTDLDFYVFCCDFYFRIGEVNFDARWRWIPVVGMARQLFESAAIAAQGYEPPAAEFSESADAISFALTPTGMLEVTTTYSHELAVCAPLDLFEATRAFLTRVCKDLAEKYPRVLESPSFAALLRNVMGANRHYARWTMREFLADPSVENAKQLESALDPFVGVPDYGPIVVYLFSKLDKYRPDGGEGLYGREDLIPAIKAALDHWSR